MYLKEILETYIKNFTGAKVAIYKFNSSTDNKVFKEELEEIDENSTNTNKGHYRVIIDLKNKVMYFASADTYHNIMTSKLKLTKNYTDNLVRIFPDKIYCTCSKAINGNVLFDSADSMIDTIRATGKTKDYFKKLLSILEDQHKNLQDNKAFISKFILYDRMEQEIFRHLKMLREKAK